MQNAKERKKEGKDQIIKLIITEAVGTKNLKRIQFKMWREEEGAQILAQLSSAAWFLGPSVGLNCSFSPSRSLNHWHF